MTFETGQGGGTQRERSEVADALTTWIVLSRDVCWCCPKFSSKEERPGISIVLIKVGW